MSKAFLGLNGDTVDGEPDSYLFLSAGIESDVRGLVESRGRVHVLGAETAAPSPEDLLVTRPADEDPMAKLRPNWRCEADKFVSPGLPGVALGAADLGSLFEPDEAISEASVGGLPSLRQEEHHELLPPALARDHHGDCKNSHLPLWV